MIKNNYFSKIKVLSLASALLTLAISTTVFAESHLNNKSGADDSPALKNAVVLIIRHGEKPPSGYELSQEGQERARAYVNYFKNFTVDSKPIRLDYLFAGADTKTSSRPRLTITPLSTALGLNIDTRFQDTEFVEIAREIQTRPHGKNILICWRHSLIPNLLSALGVDPGKFIPNAKWPEDVFGWLFQLRYDENGHLFDVKRIDENLLPDDSNKDTLAAP